MLKVLKLHKATGSVQTGATKRAKEASTPTPLAKSLKKINPLIPSFKHVLELTSK